MGDIVGCDVSKAWIDIEVVRGSARRHVRIANQAAAIKRFAKEIGEASTVGMEATGQLHELLADTMHASGHIVHVVNPRWVHNYAKSLGVRGKTDRSDATVIARFIAAEHAELHPYVTPSASQRELRRLLLQRRELVKLKAATAQSLGTKARPVVAEFAKLIARIEKEVNEIIRAEPAWQALRQRLQTEPGVGAVVAAHLVEVLHRYPFKNSDALVAHTGLDPRPCESGQKIGRRHLTHHGDAALRSLLYLAAMTACRKGYWRDFYERQLAKGLSTTAALIIIARKLTRIAFTIFRTGQAYDAGKLKIA
jgi:transposase